jgi:hypothetical protein
MKLVGAISTAVLSLSLGIGIPAYAQQEQHDQQEEQKAKPTQDKEKKAEPEKPAKQEEKNAQQDKNTKQEEKSTKQEEKTSPQQEKNARQEEKNAPQQHSQQGKPEQQAQRAGQNGGNRIPDDRFQANFGQEHRFRVSETDYRRDRRFQYGGYWFGFVQPWPTNWLYTQDVYVIEIGGVYYLCNASYPGVNVALSVTL